MGLVLGQLNRIEVNFDTSHNLTAEVMFKAGPGFQQSVFGSDPKYWSQAMKDALGVGRAQAQVNGFPFQLLLQRAESNKRKNKCKADRTAQRVILMPNISVSHY